ncbi:hypothetical protein [Paenibacillus antibioticophila]|nr:hypothetical protein [Paenibacillus antibioticophila]
MSVSFCIAAFFLSSTSAFASAEKMYVDKSKVVDILESSTVYHDAPTTSGLVRVEKIDNLAGVDKSTGKIFDKKAFKDSLLKYYSSDKVKYSENIKNIDKTIESLLSSKSNSSKINSEIVPFYSDGQVIMQGWSKEAKLISSENRVTYKTSWITEDNYRSSVPITATYTKTSSVSKSIGFEGDAEIKAKFGFTASATVSQSTTISQGADVPAWTVWGTRPYIKYKLEKYSGEYYYTIFAGGSLNTYYYNKTGENYILITKSNEYWSRTNTSKSTTATTPTPPTGAPNV